MEGKVEDRLILKASFVSQLVTFLGAGFFLFIGAGVWIVTKEFSGFSLFTVVPSGILLISVTRSAGLTLTITPDVISQKGLFIKWDVRSEELVSWQLVRKAHAPARYVKIVVRAATREHALSRWIVSGNRRYSVVLDCLRRFFGAKEDRGGPS